MSSNSRHALCACAAAITFLFTGCGLNEESGLARVKTAISTRESAAAVVEIKSFLQKHPKSAEGRFLLAQHLMAQDDHVAALAEFQRALEGGHPPQLVVPPMARAMLRSGDLTRLIDTFKNEKLQPPDAMAALSASLAMAMSLRGDTAGALALIEGVLKDSPNSAPARLMKARLVAAAGKATEGMQLIDAVLADNPKDGEAWATKGDFLLRTPGGAKAAVDAFNKAIEIRPGDLYAMTTLVSIHLALGDAEAAKRTVTRLHELAPNRFETGRSEAAVAYAFGDHARARELFQALLKAAPTNVQILLLAGENELRLNANTQAEAMFAKASSLEPGNAAARRLLAQAQLKLGQTAKALVTLAPLVDAPDANAEVLATAAEARLMNGEAKAADALYARLAKLKPADPRLRTIVASAGLGRGSDEAVFNELREIAANDKGTAADLALIAAHMKRGQPDAALTALAALDKKQPAEPRRHVLRGQILISKRDWAGARQAFEAAVAQDAAFVPAHTALAAMDAQDGKPELAIQRFQALLKKQPNNANAMLVLAELHERRGNADAEALKLRNAAVKTAPASLDTRMALINHHLARRDDEAALNAAQSAAASIPDNLELLTQLARCQMRVAQPSQALATFGKITTLQPKSPDGHLGIAAVYLSGGQLDLAQRAIDRALEMSPASPEAHAQAMLVALKRNQPEKAMAIAKQVQSQRPGHALGQMLEADVLVHQKQFTQAAAVLRGALGKQGAEAVPVKLYNTLLRANQGDDADAFAAQWLARQPQAIDMMFAIGEAAHLRGDRAKAEQYYGKILGLQPDHAQALNNQAMLLIDQHKPGALAMARRAVAQQPFDTTMLDTLAQAQAAEGNVDEAIETQKRALAITSDVPDLRLGLARLLVKAGKRGQAKAELERLAALGSAYGQQAEVAKLSQSIGSVLPGR